MPKADLAPTTFEPECSKYTVGTSREIRSSVASITAQLMEIARVQTKAGVVGDSRKGELAGKSYVEVLRGKRENRTGRPFNRAFGD